MSRMCTNLTAGATMQVQDQTRRNTQRVPREIKSTVSNQRPQLYSWVPLRRLFDTFTYLGAAIILVYFQFLIVPQRQLAFYWLMRI